MRRYFGLLSTVAGFLLIAFAFDYGTNLHTSWYWGLLFGAGFALAVLGLTDDR